MRHHRHFRAGTRGFSLLEALVALLVLSFGMLAIAGFQVTLSRSADLAKQRTEATRLAQEIVERLRSFAQVDSAVGVVNYTDDVVTDTAPSITTNATFSRTWTVTANAADTEKSVNVLVTWDDRAGQSQSVQLLSVIAKFDPQSIGTLATGPGGTGIRYPKNRNINIPFPVVGLHGGLRSAFVPPPRNVVFVFDNASGDVTHKCTGGVIPNEGDDLLNVSGAGCSTFDAYVLSGFVFFRGRGVQVDAQLLESEASENSQGGLDSSSPLAIFRAPNEQQEPAHECFALSSVAGRYIPYICVVQPVDDDGNAATRKLWSGELRVNLGGTLTIGTADDINVRRVCRFTSDYNRNLELSNREHPLYYRNVTGALSNQNFLVTRGSNSCPADVAADPLAGINFKDTNTADHQPTSEFSFRCSALDANGVDCASGQRHRYAEDTFTSLPMN